MGKRLEKCIERQCVKYAVAHGWQHFKLDKVRRGAPDQLFLGPKRKVFLVEFKRPGEVPRPQQVKKHSDLAALGFKVAIFDSFALFQAAFDQERG